MERVSSVGVLSKSLVLVVLLGALALSLWFSVRRIVIGVIHSDRAIRKSEGGSGNYSRLSCSAPGIQKSMGVAGYINSTEEFGNSRLLFFVMFGRFEEQMVDRRRLHVKMQSEYDQGAIGLTWCIFEKHNTGRCY